MSNPHNNFFHVMALLKRFWSPCRYFIIHSHKLGPQCYQLKTQRGVTIRPFLSMGPSELCSFFLPYSSQKSPFRHLFDWVQKLSKHEWLKPFCFRLSHQLKKRKHQVWVTVSPHHRHVRCQKVTMAQHLAWVTWPSSAHADQAVPALSMGHQLGDAKARPESQNQFG